jgi:formylglycine-generating enzyme required for sulfatase activity
VTQGEFQRVMGTNPSAFSATGKQKDKVAARDTKRLPVDSVSWDDAVEFCRKLSQMQEEKAAWRTYLLPSEAQWEYACRAGSTGRHSFSSFRNAIAKDDEKHESSEYGWCSENSGGMTHAVGLKPANPWGLYDMHGNVWEWCQDWYDNDYYATSPRDDPAGPPAGSFRAHRGGGWDHSAGRCRSAAHGSNLPGTRHPALGFRVSLVLPEK